MPIHRTALVDPEATVGRGVEIGPFAIVGPNVAVGDGCRIGARATLHAGVCLASGVTVGEGSILGSQPQDVKYGGEPTAVEIGAGTVIREYVTINRGTTVTGRTTVGERCFLMAYVHLAHDCCLGDGVIIANATQLAGHVTVEEHAFLSGLTAVHQFATIGAHAFVGGCTRVNQDVPPFVKAVGSPMELYGINSLGLHRAGFPRDTIAGLKRAYRLCFNSDLPRAHAVAAARAEIPALPQVERFLAFVEGAERGVPA